MPGLIITALAPCHKYYQHLLESVTSAKTISLPISWSRGLQLYEYSAL